VNISWWPDKPAKISDRMFRQLEQLERSFTKIHGRRPFHASISCSTDGRDLTYALFDAGLPSQALIRVDMTPFDAAEARVRQRKIWKQRLQLETNRGEVRAIVAEAVAAGHTYAEIAPLLNIEVDTLLRLVGEEEVI
jgi:hypothetical protein